MQRIQLERHWGRRDARTVSHDLHSLFHRHLLAEDLKAIAIRVIEVDAIGHRVLGNIDDVGSVGHQLVVELPKLVDATVYLKGDVALLEFALVELAMKTPDG